MDETKIRLRYQIDFDATQAFCQNGQGTVIGRLLQGSGILRASLYNMLWQHYYPERPLTTKDIDCQLIQDKGDCMILITLPVNNKDNQMVCYHIVLTFHQFGKRIADPHFYHIEYGNMETTAIGSMRTDSNSHVAHMNYCPACENAEESITTIWEIAFYEDLEFQRAIEHCMA